MSNYIRLANLFQLYYMNQNGTIFVERRYTNGCNPGSSLQYNGFNFDYLSFIYQGAAKNRTGDNLQAGLVLSTNPISTGLAQQAISNRWHVTVWSVVIAEDGTVNRTLTQEDWVAASMTYDAEAVEVILSSGIDAVGAAAPYKVLTREMVGSLPVTASIQAR